MYTLSNYRGHCIVRPPTIYSFKLSRPWYCPSSCYIKFLITPAIALSVLLLYTVSNYPGHCIVRPPTIYSF
jgi:hypothetical protein